MASGSETNGEFITLARVVKTQGRHGEVAAETHSDVPGRFAQGMKLFALPKLGRVAEEAARRELEVENLWPHKGLVVLKFRGVDSMNDAELLIGSELQVPKAERADLETGWTYISDLIGCTVLDHAREIAHIARRLWQLGRVFRARRASQRNRGKENAGRYYGQQPLPSR